MRRWLLPFLAMVIPQQALAGDICWIDRVEKHGDGVLVYFSDTREVALSHDGSLTRYLIAATPPAYSGSKFAVLPALPAELNDKFSAHNGPEDSCSMTVVREAGQIGVRAEAAFALPGFMRMNGNKPQWVTRFIAAH